MAFASAAINLVCVQATFDQLVIDIDGDGRPDTVTLDGDNGCFPAQ